MLPNRNACVVWSKFAGSKIKKKSHWHASKNWVSHKNDPNAVLLKFL